MTRRQWVLLIAATTACVVGSILGLAATGDRPDPSELFAPPGSYWLTPDGRYIPLEKE